MIFKILNFTIKIPPSNSNKKPLKGWVKQAEGSHDRESKKLYPG